MNKIICGDCLEVMKTMEDNSIDSIVSDPPYELGEGNSIKYTAKASKSERNKGCEELFVLKEKIPEDDLNEIKHLLSI